jgi:hypothetical protein
MEFNYDTDNSLDDEPQINSVIKYQNNNSHSMSSINSNLSDENIIVIDSNTFYVIEHTNKISIISIPKNEKIYYLYALTKCIFFNKHSSSFISFTENDDETSLFIDEKSLKYLPDNISLNLSRKDNFRLIQIRENDHGIDHIGIVSKIATLFTNNAISILYINSYNNNFILLEQCDYDRAIELLKAYQMAPN